MTIFYVMLVFIVIAAIIAVETRHLLIGCPHHNMFNKSCSRSKSNPVLSERGDAL